MSTATSVLGEERLDRFFANSMSLAVLSGDTAKAKTAYQDFFGLWKDADPDLPILKQAKAEYATLQ